MPRKKKSAVKWISYYMQVVEYKLSYSFSWHEQSRFTTRGYSVLNHIEIEARNLYPDESGIESASVYIYGRDNELDDADESNGSVGSINKIRGEARIQVYTSIPGKSFVWLASILKHNRPVYVNVDGPRQGRVHRMRHFSVTHESPE